jgi:hypothetical protein
MKRLAGLLVGVFGLALAVSSNQAVAATECNGFISGTVDGGVVVNDGDVCFLGGNIILGPGTLHVGARVSGGVRVNAGGVLFVCASTIDGGLVADGAAVIIVGAEEILCDGGVINGGVQISNTGPGDLVDPDAPPSLALERSVIHGAVHLTGNQGHISVVSNTIAGGLFCDNNAFNLDDEGLAPSTVTGRVTCEFE